jgi:hypothetical protein
LLTTRLGHIRFGGKRLNKFTHWDLIKRVIWHINLEMRARKHLSAYYMTYKTFIYLVRKLEPFVKFEVTMFDRAPLELRKAISH